MNKTPFHAVSIVAKSGGSRCGAAQAIDGVRYFCQETPQLPLAGCENPAACRCVYQHHEDRREDCRRDADAGIAGQIYLAAERRNTRGRRKTDQPAATVRSIKTTMGV